MSWLAELVMEVLILGFTLGQVDNNVSAPAEETVMVGTTPLVTMWDEWERGPTTNGGVSSSSSSTRGSRSVRLRQKEVERSMSDDYNMKG